MAGPTLYATHEYGAAAYSDAFNPSYSSLNYDYDWQDINYNLHDREFNEFLSDLIGADDLNLGRDLLSDNLQSDESAGTPAPSMHPMPSPSTPLPSHNLPSTLAPESIICDLRPQPILQPACTLALSPSSSTPMVLQESAIWNLQPQVFQRQASLTLFAPSRPPPSKVEHIQCLPYPHNVSKDSINGAPHHAEFAFHLDAIFVEGAGRLWGDTFKAPASDTHMQPLARAVESINIEDAHLHLVAQGHNLTESSQYGSQYLAPAPNSCLGYNRAFSDSAIMEFSNASASSLSYKDSEQNKHLSAPVSPSPSVNKGAPPESFQNVYKLNDKDAWRKHRVRVIKKKMKYSRACDGVSAIVYLIGQVPLLRGLPWMTMPIKPILILRKVTLRYGEKVIKNQKYTRNYYKCDKNKRTQCPVRKQTQRSGDEECVEFLYLGRHNHLP
ncbi:hypothetical protein GOP47_0021481 [Adiantum capillus-veneris]|uniref:WRKY domain-containing protein n=1 Tax=Adiantum capillus-veneris TaxID=13818 RepID=A0A9D4Z6A7_ADICA|nr:hypothetical protein GOP47_0021481 [Adiantum capillus-veneris]